MFELWPQYVYKSFAVVGILLECRKIKMTLGDKDTGSVASSDVVISDKWNNIYNPPSFAKLINQSIK